MIPSRLLLIITAILAGLAFVAVFLPQVASLWPPLAAVVLGVTLLDALLANVRPKLNIRRELRHSIPVGVWSKVTLELENDGGRSLRLRVHDHHPASFAMEGMPVDLALPTDRKARLVYRVKPGQRGDAMFKGTDLIISSPFGLWQRKRFTLLEEKVRVFPNFREVSHYTLLATENRLSQMGVRRRQRRGEGSDFHQLREYRAGDSLRQIDWKASSRYRKLISKEYQDERDQQVIFMLDCGRRMRHQEDGRGHLDQALNALLLLAHVASHQGDGVGFMAFGGTHRWYPPRKGGNQMRQLLHQVYDIESSLSAADYMMAARELMPVQRRRALVVLLTNSRDEDHEDLLQAVRLLQKRHLVIVADLRETLLDETLEQRVGDLDSALRFQAVNEYMESRNRNLELLRHHGAYALDLLAEQLPVALVNQYLTVKASGRL
ncbi:MAG: DUF58 domain-containing protein [Gammaproteobacteria bacterium]|nr:DUF58 domain-containing protein [Gammaproteobacteria bacterium]